MPLPVPSDETSSLSAEDVLKRAAITATAADKSGGLNPEYLLLGAALLTLYGNVMYTREYAEKTRRFPGAVKFATGINTAAFASFTAEKLVDTVMALSKLTGALSLESPEKTTGAQDPFSRRAFLSGRTILCMRLYGSQGTRRRALPVLREKHGYVTPNKVRLQQCA